MKVAFIRKAANSSPLFTALVMIAHAPSLVRSIDATKIAISQQQQRRKAFLCLVSRCGPPNWIEENDGASGS
jgi:hypothetical protein